METVTAWEEVTWRDIGWTVRHRPPPGPEGGDYGDTSWEFEGFQVEAEDAVTGTLYYERAGAETNTDTVTDLDEAWLQFKASVNWDGCSNWHWTTEACMWHACSFDGPDGITSMGEVMRRTYALAATLIRHWDADTADYVPGERTVAGEVVTVPAALPPTPDTPSGGDRD